MTGPSRRIIAGPDLPRSFAVIESTSYREAVQDMRDAFANPDIHLVVWNKAADLVSDQMKEEIGILRDRRIRFACERELNKARGFLDKILHGDESPELRLHRNFNTAARKAKLPRTSLSCWEENTQSFISALRESINPSFLSELVRVKPIDQKPQYHYDGIQYKPSDFAIFRNFCGEMTEYYEPEALLRSERIHPNPLIPELNFVKDDATRWMADPMAIAFHSAKILHSAPSVQNAPFAAGQFRVSELFVIHGKTEVMACNRLG